MGNRQWELPNLLHAVDGALQAEDEEAVEFVTNVNRFLGCFGLQRERAALTRRADQAAGAVGSRTWYLARFNQGQQLLSAGRYQDAQQVFDELLRGLGTAPSDKRCLTLGRLGRCLHSQGRLEAAEAQYRQALAVAQQLESSEWVQRQRAALQTELADVLTDRGDYAGARVAYAVALTIDQALRDFRGAAVINGQLGALALVQNDLPEAERRYRETLTAFQRLGEPAMEAVVWHNLGRVYEEARQRDGAERAYREAARIQESLGDLAGAASTWNNLAIVTESAGKPAEAEGWYRKAFAGSKKVNDQVRASRALHNLAGLLRNQPGRLAEARQWAEEALAIAQTLDSVAAEIWKTYDILADIAALQSHAEQARDYCRWERETYAGFAGAWYALRRHALLIAAVVATAVKPAQRSGLEAQLEEGAKRGWGDLAAVLRRLLDGERDEEVLCEGLNRESWLIIHAILQGIADPASLQALLSSEPENQ